VGGGGRGVRRAAEDDAERASAARRRRLGRRPSPAGVRPRLALAHTWGNPIGTDPGLTYLGPELDLSVIRINLTLGVLFRVAGDGGAGTLFSWGLGFGLAGGGSVGSGWFDVAKLVPSRVQE